MMACERFEDLLVDDLYGELDELTSAALKRHATTCARCSARQAALRATRDLATFPLVEPPPDLEMRILQAARDAQKVVPIGSRRSRGVVTWLMRPQIAVAAAFLLMVGSSALLVSRNANEPSRTATASIDDDRAKGAEDEPAAAAPATGARTEDDSIALADEAREEQAGQAFGKQLGDKTTAKKDESSVMGGAGGALALADDERAERKAGELSRGRSMGSSNGLRSATKSGDDMPSGSSDQLLAETPKGMIPPASRAAAGAAGAYGGRAGGGPAQTPALTPAAEPARNAESERVRSRAMQAYQSGKYADAARDFDTLARAGDVSAALWAARSIRASRGCAAAVSRFDAVSSSASGSAIGHDATLESADCYRTMGAESAARVRYERLVSVSTHATRAKRALAQLDSARGESDSPSGPRHARPRRKAPAKPASPPPNQQKGL